jgi:hypothetical protein
MTYVESEHGPARNPCGSCPYRRDVPSGVWAAEEYEKLPRFDGPTMTQPPGIFLCHQQNGRMCAGWVGCHDMDESLGIRLAHNSDIFTDADIKAAMNYECPIPLWGSGAEAAAHGLREVEQPSEQAARTIDKLVQRRERRTRRA